VGPQRPCDTRGALRIHGLLAALASIAAAGVFAILLFGRLSHPLFWYDESETAMFGRRVLEYGYPRVHGPRNTIYSLWHRSGVGLHEATDSYTGSPWLQYYVAALGEVFAARVDDPYAKTLRVRLPFAVLGALGLALLVAAVLPAVGGSPARRLGFAAALFLLFGYSVSLVLHLREARHYPLTLLLTAAALWVYLRRQVFGRLGPAAHAAGLGLALFLLFHTFFPAFAVLCAAMALHLGWRAARGRGSPRELLPLALAAAAVAPGLAFFDFLAQTRGWVEQWGAHSSYLGNLGFIAWFLARYELLVPALLMRVAAEGLAAGGAPPGGPEPAQRRQIARILLLVAVTWALLLARTPFLFERYFVVLGPLLAVMLALDAIGVAEGLLRARGRARRIAGLAASLAALGFIGSIAVRAPDFAGRLQELRVPYRGPLDFVIPYLAETHPEPSALVIATNYEETAFMYYLGSQVTVGFYGAELERDLRIQPDVIVPRPWPEQIEVLKELSQRAAYRAREFPVTNLWWNNVPSLAPRGARRAAHRFRTPLPAEGEPALVILERVPAPERG